MFKNTASQKVYVFAFDATTNVPKTADAANITAYVAKDFGSVTVLGDTSATECDATNAPGYYLFDITQTETNADVVMVSGKSSTSNIKVIGAPATIFTYPATGILAPATSGRTLVVDASGLADANAVKVGPTGSGTAQTARDLGASVLLSTGTGTGQLDFTSGVVKASLAQILGTALTETAGQLAGGFKKFFNIAAPAATMDHGILTDTVTTISSAPTVQNVVDGVWNEVMSGHTTSSSFGDKLRASLTGMQIVVLAAGSDTTHLVLNTVDGSAASGTNDVYNGRTVIMTSGTLAKQGTTITAYVGATKTATVSALTGSAAVSDTAIIV